MKLAQIPHSEKYYKMFYEQVHYKSAKLELQHIEDANKQLKSSFENEIEYKVLEFLADEFAKFDTKENYEYMVPNYYADRIFNRIPGFKTEEEIDGIIYPSIANSYEEKNIVLKPEVVDKKLSFIHAMQIWMVYHEGSIQHIPIIQNVKSDEEGRLHWDLKSNIYDSK